MVDFSDYRWLTEEAAQGWLKACESDSRPLHQQLKQLRKALSTTRAKLVLEQQALRVRAKVKFGRWAKAMFFTEIGLQQATDRWLAAYKASRFTEMATRHDLCCGIGGDLSGFAACNHLQAMNSGQHNECFSVCGWDLDPRMVLFANRNLEVFQTEDDEFAPVISQTAHSIQVQEGDIEQLNFSPDDLWHLDPDRRSEGRRSVKIEHHQPSLPFVERLRMSHPHGGVKLAPACEVPSHWTEGAELEWISRDRTCRQLVVWFGKLATCPGNRRATIILPAPPTSISANHSFALEEPTQGYLCHTLVGQAGQQVLVADSLEQYLFDPDPSVLAADLVGELATRHELKSLVPGGAYLTGVHPLSDPHLACFQVLDQLPLRIKPLSKYLATCDIGSLEIKKRGVELNPSQLRKQLKLRGTAQPPCF